MSIKSILEQRVSAALEAAGAQPGSPPVIARSKQAKFGDFQANGVMGAAKKLGKNPREFGAAVLDKLDLSDIATSTELAGPGFINIGLSEEFLNSQLQKTIQKATTTSDPQTIVIDYSSPNLAKEMHVGHLRSTIIGDAVARVLEYLGHSVIRQNHMGDWGTQFGMLIAELEAEQDADTLALKDLEKFYQQAKKHFDEDTAFADKAREYVVRLQSGDKHCTMLWQRFIDISVSHSIDIYKALGVSLKQEHIQPESAYNDMLGGVIKKLQDQNMAVDDAGAKVVFLDELADKEGNPSVVIVQKSDGGFLYSTSDLAAAQYRATELNADRVLYFIDARQSLHMKQIFLLARKAGFVPKEMQLEHHAFGTMMGKDGKPFKTRTGGTIKLADFLEEAKKRAADLLAERSSDLDKQAQADVARKVGIGAIKYADLSKTRTNDYIFDWDGMLSFEGNTAPYLQYAYTRIQSLFRKANVDAQQYIQAIPAIAAPEERALALLLMQFDDVIAQVAADAYPHTLCNYLYDTASAYMSFYEACPILKEGISDREKQSRLTLSAMTAHYLKTGLELLGIEVMDVM